MDFSLKQRTYFRAFILIVLLVWFGIFLLHRIDLTIVDLGRHIKNGEFILKGDFSL